MLVHYCFSTAIGRPRFMADIIEFSVEVAKLRNCSLQTCSFLSSITFVEKKTSSQTIELVSIKMNTYENIAEHMLRLCIGSLL